MNAYVIRADSKFAPSQWKTALFCNDVFHWLGTRLESALCYVTSLIKSAKPNNHLEDCWLKQYTYFFSSYPNFQISFKAMMGYQDVNSPRWCTKWNKKILNGPVPSSHYSDAIMSAMASQITGVPILYSSVCSGADQRKRQSSSSLAFVRGI